MNVGDKVGFWTIIDVSEAKKANGYKILCRCDCGNIRRTQRTYLNKGKSKSCGCDGIYVGRELDCGTVVAISRTKANARNITISCNCGELYTTRLHKQGGRASCPKCTRHYWSKHGYATDKPKEYRAWKGMRYRCNNPSSKGWAAYGGRGVRVDPRWDDFNVFLADMGPAPEDSREYSVDRINNDGHYAPGNCRWTTIDVQANNRHHANQYTGPYHVLPPRAMIPPQRRDA